LKVRLIGNNGDKEKLTNILNNLNISSDIDIISDEFKDKYNVKYGPAIIVDNIVIDDVNNLSNDELSSIFKELAYIN